MKLFVYIFVFFYYYYESNAQNINTFYSYPVNLYAVNPAYTGAETYIPVQVGMQRYNTGVAQGIMNLTASAHIRYRNKVKNAIKKEAIAVDVFRPASVRNTVTNQYFAKEKAYRDSINLEQKDADSTYKEAFDDEQRRIARLPFHGFGGIARNEFISQNYIQTSFALSYAIHLFVAPGVRLSVGAGLGIQNMSQRALTFREGGDDIAQNYLNPQAAIGPDANIGTMLIGQKYYIGLSAHSLLGQPQLVKDAKSASNNLIFHAIAGYKFKINKKLSVIPAVLVRVNHAVNPTIDLSARVLYNTIWAGVLYRHKEVIGVLAGINLDKTWDISYAYGYTTATAFSSISYGTHEIILGYRLKNKNYGLKSKFF